MPSPREVLLRSLRRNRDGIVSALERVPWIGAATLEAAARRRFRVERALLAGQHRPRSSNPSVLHLTVSRAASQFVRRILQAAASDTGMDAAYLGGLAAWSDVPHLDEVDLSEHPLGRAFLPTGVVYVAIGGPIRGLDLTGYRPVLVLRDPRDVIVSEHRSLSAQHPLPGRDKRERFLAQRHAVEAAGLADWALDRAPVLADRYVQLHAIARETGAPVLWYEDMVADLDGFMDALLGATGLSLSARNCQQFRAEWRAPVGNDPKRQRVAPGEHERLDHGVLDSLEELLAPALAILRDS